MSDSFLVITPSIDTTAHRLQMVQQRIGIGGGLEWASALSLKILFRKKLHFTLLLW